MAGILRGFDSRRLHFSLLASYLSIGMVRARQVGDDLPAGPVATLQAGIAHEREWVRYWQDLRTGHR